MTKTWVLALQWLLQLVNKLIYTEMLGASLMAQIIKSLPAMQKTQVQSLDWEDPLEKEMATHCSALVPGKSHGRRSLGGYSPWGHKESDTTGRLTHWMRCWWLIMF